MLLDRWFPVAIGVIRDSGVWLIVVVGAGCQDDGFALSGVSSNRVQDIRCGRQQEQNGKLVKQSVTDRVASKP